MPDKGPEQFVEFEITTRVRTTPERYKNFLDMIRAVAIEPIEAHIVDSQGNNMMFKLPEKAFDPTMVTLDELHYFKKHHMEDETPNTVSTVAFHRLSAGLSDDVKTMDKKGAVKAIQTRALIDRCNRVLSGQDRDVTGDKTLGFIRGLIGYLEVKEAKSKESEKPAKRPKKSK